MTEWKYYEGFEWKIWPEKGTNRRFVYIKTPGLAEPVLLLVTPEIAKMMSESLIQELPEALGTQAFPIQ